MKILGYTYTVEYGPDCDRMGASGRCNTGKLYIQIADDLSPEQERSTALHEVIEALNYHLSLNISHDAIMALEAGLFQVLEDNGVDVAPLLRGLVKK